MLCGQRGLYGVTAAPPAMPELLFGVVIVSGRIMAEKNAKDPTQNLVHAFWPSVQVAPLLRH